jgi:Flp pilus assembly protein TadG
MSFLVRFCAFCKANDGAALIELAFVTPMLLLLVLGAADLGRAYYVGLEVANAAHAGAEYSALNFSTPAKITTAYITAAATQSAPNVSGLIVATPTWGCECSDGTSYSASCTSAMTTCSATGTRGSNVVYRVQVQASATYNTLVPWPFIPSQITLSKTATIRGNP